MAGSYGDKRQLWHRHLFQFRTKRLLGQSPFKSDFAIGMTSRLFIWKNPSEIWNPSGDCSRWRFNVEHGHPFGHTRSGNMNTFMTGSAPNVQVTNFVAGISNVLEVDSGFAAGWAFEVLALIELSCQMQPFVKNSVQWAPPRKYW
jgi:hypothetical protein